MACDPDFGSVVSLLHFDGADASTTFTDVKGKTWAAGSNAQIDTARFKYGTAAGLFAASGDYIETANSADFNFGSGDFTFEAWVYLTDLTAVNVLAARWVAGNAANCAWLLKILTTGKLQFVYNGTETAAASTATVSLNTWTHIAFSKTGTTLTYSVAGITENVTLTSGTLNDSTSKLYVGRDVPNNLDQFYGSIDDLRITKGVNRYTANFTPPTEAFPDVLCSDNGAGSSSGTSTVSATSQAIYSATGLAAGTSTVSADGVSNVGAGNANGMAVATATGGSISTAAATSNAVAGAGAVGAGIARTDGNAAATASVSAVGGRLADGAAASAGTSTASATGYAVRDGAGAAAGGVTVSAEGAFLRGGVASSAGTSGVAATGVTLVLMTGIAQGAAGTNAAGQSSAASSASSAGVAGVSAVGRAPFQSAFLANGLSGVTGEGRALGASTGVSAGLTSVNATAQPIATGGASASGSSVATASARAFAQAVAVAPGVAGGYFTPSLLERSSALHTISARKRIWRVRQAKREFAVAERTRIWRVNA